MAKPIKNYTSQVDSFTSIARIERVLMRLGANRVIKDYDREMNCVSAIMFELEIKSQSVVFKLPARVDACFRVINSKRKKKTEDGAERDMAQAERTAWKIILDWIEAQAALIELEQADLPQIFLPYAYNPATNETLYEVALKKGFEKLLLES